MEDFSAVLFCQFILEEFDLGSLPAAGSSDENECLWFLLHALHYNKKFREAEFFKRKAEASRKVLVFPHRDLCLDLLDEIDDD
jgi:hypothetical protein